MINLDLAKFNPSQVFKHPDDVLKTQEISVADKVDILRRWAYDEREKAVAEEENMHDKAHECENLLDEISRCLIALQSAIHD